MVERGTPAARAAMNRRRQRASHVTTPRTSSSLNTANTSRSSPSTSRSLPRTTPSSVNRENGNTGAKKSTTTETPRTRPVSKMASLSSPPAASRSSAVNPVDQTKDHEATPTSFPSLSSRLPPAAASKLSSMSFQTPPDKKTKQVSIAPPTSAASSSQSPLRAKQQHIYDTPTTAAANAAISHSTTSVGRDVSGKTCRPKSRGSTKENRPTTNPFQHLQKYKDKTKSPIQRGVNNLLEALPVVIPSMDTDDSSTAASSDDESVTQDIGPLAGKDEVLDATCLVNESLVTIRPHSSNPAVSLSCFGEDQPELGTGGLGRAEQVCRVLKFSQQRHTYTAASHAESVIRYGDTVALCSPSLKNRALGVHRKPNQQQPAAEQIYDVGFFRSSLGHEELWTVIWGGTTTTSSKRTVVVGRRALSRRTSRRHPTTPQTRAAVRSVDYILLRNNATGGLLSFQHGNDLTLVTDSYDSSSGMNGSTTNASLLGRLQKHSRMVPRPSEHFQLVHASVPPCPQWVSSTGNNRFYLDGSYLLHPERNELNAFVIESLFGSSQHVGSFFDEISANSESRQIQTVTVHAQERLLLDDVIGSLMGLEGRHVKPRIQATSDDQTAKSMDDMEFWLCDKELSVDTSLRNLVELILPLSTYFVRVQAFVSCHLPGYEYGTVMQALCEGLDSLLQDYLGFAAQMDQSYRRCSQAHQPSAFTMNKLYVAVRPALETMSILHHVIVSTRALKGGALLNALRDLMTNRYAGDEKGRRVLNFLLERASVPYMNMLTMWLETGVLQDPFGEFMIEPRKNNVASRRGVMWVDYDGDDWENLYRIRQEHVLEGVLSPSLIKQQILATGKCWNAIRYCRRTNRSGEDDDDDALVLEDSSLALSGQDLESVSLLQYNMDIVTISSHIDRLHRSASKALVDLILVDFSLNKTLRTMKRFFLLDQGDFFVHFLDSAEEELLKEIDEVPKGRIQNWLNMSIQLTERHVEDAPRKKKITPGMHISLKKPVSGYPLTPSSIRCSFAAESLEKHLDGMHAARGGIETHEPKTPSRNPYGIAEKGLTGLEAFMPDFPSIPFPTSLVISKCALESYQLLFRHLFFAKHVERRLVGIWLDHQMMKELQALRGALGPTYFLRQRMLHFMQNLIYYMMFEVIEPNWLEMDKAVNGRGKSLGEAGQKEAQRTVDDIRKVHSEFLSRTREECLLTNRDIIRTLYKLMNTCLLFSDQLKRFMEATKIYDEKHNLSTEKRRALQRNLTNPDHQETLQDKKRLRRVLVAEREEKRIRIRRHTALVQRELSNGSYSRMISRFDEVFNGNLADFMSELQSDSDDRYHSHRANLCVRLDYNGYVARSMGLNL